MATAVLVPVRHSDIDASSRRTATAALSAAVLANFVVILDAVIVNVALPSIRDDFAGGITGLQWVADGYTLMFAALLLCAGAITDRIGARRAFNVGAAAFVAASAVCALAPGLAWLIGARFVQGSAAAVMMPASMALLSQAFPDPTKRGRAVALWAVGGAIAASSGPVLGGVLTLLSWRWIFLVNIPVGLAAIVLTAPIATSTTRRVRIDWAGLVAGIVAMGALTYGAIEAGAAGLTDPRVILASGVAVASGLMFWAVERRIDSPMVPLDLLRTRNVLVASAVGFAFMAGYYGLPFVMSLYLQQGRGLSSLQTGLLFLPMMFAGAVLTPFSARLAERVGPRKLVGIGMLFIAAGLAVLAAAAPNVDDRVIAALMVVVGVGGPLVMPPVTAVVLNTVATKQAGTASGVFNTSRQLGGALAVAVFGAFLGNASSIASGVTTSLLIAAGTAAAAAATSQLLKPPATAT
jgi:EmrB/QacA subfamily drug resistance transporter